MAETAWWNRVVHLMMAKKQKKRDEGSRDKVHSLRACSPVIYFL
jgi:hypothetical protein